MIGKSLALRALAGSSVAWLLSVAACGAPASSGSSGAKGTTASNGSSGSNANTTAGSVAGRVQVVNAALSVTTPATAQAHRAQAHRVLPQGFTATGSSAYTYVAAVNAPTNPATSDVLQATNFAFDATRAYVTYNMDGPAIEGALDVIDLSSPTTPALIGSLIFGSEEFADIAITGTTALLVGQDNNGGLLTVVDISDPTQPKELSKLSLGSYYGTSIALDGTNAYVATGDSGGGVVTIDVSTPTAPKISNIAALDNALSAIRASGMTLALGGSGGTDLFNVSTGTAVSLAPIGSEVFAAPVRMAVASGLIVTNGAHSGLTVLTPTNNYTSATVTFHADLTGTGNGVDVAGNLTILAQGEAGTLLYDVTVPDSPALLGSFDFPDDRGSANEVRFGTSGASDYVFLSDGLSGFRIILVGSATDDAGAACNDQWWLAQLPGDWWSAPVTTDASSPARGRRSRARARTTASSSNSSPPPRTRNARRSS